MQNLKIAPIAQWRPGTAPQHPRHLEETATTQGQPPFYAPPSHRRSHPARRRRAPTLMTINKERAARLGCSQNGICKALKRYRITVKKDFRHRKADEEKRHEFLEVKSVYEERLHPFVYIDESGFRKDISRPYGYAPRGQKCVGASGWDKAQTNVIGALCGTVSFAFTAFDCSIDSDVFHTWATEIRLSELPACSVIVMDNAPFHKRQNTLDALRLRGHTVCGSTL